MGLCKAKPCLFLSVPAAQLLSVAQPKPAQAIIFTNPAEHAMSCSVLATSRLFSGNYSASARSVLPLPSCNAGGGARRAFPSRPRPQTHRSGRIAAAFGRSKRGGAPVGAPFLGLGSLLLPPLPLPLPKRFCAANERKERSVSVGRRAKRLPLRSSPQQKGRQGGNKAEWCHAGLVVRFRRRQDASKDHTDKSRDSWFVPASDRIRALLCSQLRRMDVKNVIIVMCLYCKC